MVSIVNQVRNSVFYPILALLINCWLAEVSFAQGKEKESSFNLEYPKSMAERVAFWEDLFQIYDSQTVLIHDSQEPQLILDILPFHKMAKTTADKSLLNSGHQKKLVERYIQRYQIAVSRFATNGKNARSFGPMEQRVYEVFSRSEESLQRLLQGKTVKIRQQRGLSDTFITAAIKAQDFLPYIESEFRAKGVPIELSRIAFVESMFNEQAVSKVGASGVFQFMRDTAQDYLIVNSLIDERNSPIKAARAAAQLFKENFNDLGNWPLAVTAYNHGRGGVSKAVRSIKSDHLPDLIKYWKAPSFGFASQNFFAEFSAARLTYDKLIREGTISMRPTRLRLVSGKIKESITLDNLAYKLGISLSEILEHNPCINKKIARQNSKLNLPRGFELLIPAESTMLSSIDNLTLSRPFNDRKIAYEDQSKSRRIEK